ncbi:MAG: glycosyltransferase family 2 protein [Bacteroidia bacterium]
MFPQGEISLQNTTFALVVSVILPFYNAQLTLGKAIESVLSQSFTNFELILVNNNSNDTSLKIARHFALKDPRIKVVAEGNQGVRYAMNRGLAQAENELIARIDADDEWFESKLEKQVNYLAKNPKVDVIATQAKYGGIGEGLKQYVHWSNSVISEVEINNSIFIESPIINPTVVFRKKLITEHGNYSFGANIPEDYEMFLRWHSNGVRMHKLPQELMQWNDLETRLTRTHKAYTNDAFNRIKCSYLAKFLKKRKSIWIWGAGRKTRRRAETLNEFDIGISGYIDIVKQKTSVAQCIYFKDILLDEHNPIISFVANRGARDKVRDFLLNKGFIEMQDFIIA